MQPVIDGDFEIEAKFESALATDGQQQGILVEQDPDNVVRIEFHRTSGQTKIFVASIFGGVANTHLLQVLAVSEPMYLRVDRVGNQFAVSYSTDGESFILAKSFSQPMTVNQVGVYVGNALGTSHTAVVDYFWSVATPVPVPEPGFVLMLMAGVPVLRWMSGRRARR